MFEELLNAKMMVLMLTRMRMGMRMMTRTRMIMRMRMMTRTRIDDELPNLAK